MITARKLRDAAFAAVLAIPTISMTRPVATEALSPAAQRSQVMENAAFAQMTADQKRAALPTDRSVSR